MKALGFLICFILIGFLIYNAIRHFLISQKSKLISLIRRYPLLPFPQDGFKEFEASEKLKTLVPQARIQVCQNYTKRQECWNGKKQAIEKMNEIMRWIVKRNRKESGENHGLHEEKIEDLELVPNEARLISIRMDGFKHGELCHEFEPTDGLAEGSSFTWQMFGDNRIQVTNYIEDGVSYIAGFCIYIDSPWTSGNHFRIQVIKKFFDGPKLPIRVRTRNVARVMVKNEHQVEVRVCNNSSPTPSEQSIPEEGGPSSDMVIKWCPKLRRNIMSKVENEVVVHEEWDPTLKKMKNVKCTMCMDVLMNEPPPEYSSLRS